MVNNLEEALDLYRANLKEYVEWINPLKARMDAALGKGNWTADGHLEKDDWQRATMWNAEMSAQAKVLGLTKEEIEQFEREAGIEKT